MKQLRSNAFTMIEMLTVVTIIGLLIALLFPTIKTALRKAEMGQARVEVKTIAHAIQAYYTEYGVLPYCPSTGAITFSTGDALGGGNPRGIIFLNPPTRKGAISSAGVIQDPWGNPYQAQLDCAYTGSVTVNGNTAYASVMVYSYGPDAAGTSTFNNNSIYSNQ